MDMAAMAAGLQAVTTGINTLRTTLGLVKDIQGVMPPGEKKEVVAKSLNTAEEQIQLAEADIARGFGYPLCRCKRLPTPMLEVGEYFVEPLISPPHQAMRAKRVIVNQCPCCNRHDGPQNDSEWTRTVPQSSG
jgi:hypothetical protein